MLNWNFQMGWGGVRKDSFCGRGIDIFKNHVILPYPQPLISVVTWEAINLRIS